MSWLYAFGAFLLAAGVVLFVAALIDGALSLKRNFQDE